MRPSHCPSIFTLVYWRLQRCARRRAAHGHSPFLTTVSDVPRLLQSKQLLRGFKTFCTGEVQQGWQDCLNVEVCKHNTCLHTLWKYSQSLIIWRKSFLWYNNCSPIYFCHKNSSEWAARHHIATLLAVLCIWPPLYDSRTDMTFNF